MFGTGASETGAYVDGALGLDEPASDHRLELPVAHVRVGGADLALDVLLQQEALQSPVQVRAARAPVQDVLSTHRTRITHLTHVTSHECQTSHCTKCTSTEPEKSRRAQKRRLRRCKPCRAFSRPCHVDRRTALPPVGTWAAAPPPAPASEPPTPPSPPGNNVAQSEIIHVV